MQDLGLVITYYLGIQATTALAETTAIADFRGLTFFSLYMSLTVLNQRLTCCQFPIAKSATGADCPNFCMMPPCQSGAMCPDTYDSNGCLMPPTCSPNIAPCGEFPSWEQVVKACPKSQYDSYGCEVNPGNFTLSDKTFSDVRNQSPLATYF